MNQWSRYTDNQIHKALTSFRNFNRSGTEADLHELRVHLKKIKAALVFVRRHGTSKGNKTPVSMHSLKRFFRQAGTVREIGLRLNWLQAEGFAPLVNASDSYRRLQRLVKKLSENESKYASRLRRIQKKLTEHASRIRASAIRTYCSDLKQTITLIALSGSSEEWHELRKTIKQLLYALQWVNAVDANTIITKQQRLKLEDLQEQIGLWHDLMDHHNWLLQQGFFSSQNQVLKELSALAIKRIHVGLRLQAQKVDLLLQETIPDL